MLVAIVRSSGFSRYGAFVLPPEGGTTNDWPRWVAVTRVAGYFETGIYFSGMRRK
jgi:hypothetical protein